MSVDADPAAGSGAETAADRWARDLAAWRIPDEILAQAPQSPWIHPVELFRAEPGTIADSPSHRLARAALPDGGAVLDVGCGGGRAALAQVPPAARVVGVDHQAGMLEAFAQAAADRGVEHVEVLGDWPDVATSTPAADVVVCHHVAYNVAALPAFVAALATHARHRVVLELPQRHPLATMAPFWRLFWGLERPDGPTAADALAVVREAGFDAHLEEWDEEGDRRVAAIPFEQQVEFLRIRLCLPADRDPEVAQAMREHSQSGPRRLATLWWDVEVSG